LVREARTETGSDPNVKGLIENAQREFEASMDDDFNTANALAAIHNMVREINIVLAGNGLRSDDQKYVLELVGRFDSVLGIFGEEKEDLLDDEIDALIAERQEARKQRNFTRSDEIRDLLAVKGIILEDT